MNENNDLINANRGPKVIIIITVFPFIAFITVILRLFTRIKLIHNQGIDDWISVVALIFSVATSVFFALQVQYGMGRHYKLLTNQQAMNFYKTLYISIIIYNVGLLFTKISILLQYLRVATNKRIRLACYLVMLFTVMYGTEAFFTGVFHCWPISRFWGETKDGKCFNKPILWFLNAGLNITNDLLLLILPIFILSVSTLPRKQKVRICLILSLGGFTAIVSVWRLYSLYVVSISRDMTWDIAEMAIWSCIELNVGISCACVSTLRPLTSQFFPFVHRNSSSNSQIRGMSEGDACETAAVPIPSMIESRKAELVSPVGRSADELEGKLIKHINSSYFNSNINLASYQGFRPGEKYSDCINYESEVSSNRQGLIFSKLLNYPALVVVDTHR